VSRVDAAEWISELRRALTQLADADHCVELRADVISVVQLLLGRHEGGDVPGGSDAGVANVADPRSPATSRHWSRTSRARRGPREFLLELESLPAASGAHSSPTALLGFHGLTRLPHSAMKTAHQRRIREDDGALTGFVAMSLDNYGYQARSDHEDATDTLRFRQPLHGGCGHVGVRRHAGSLADMSS